MKWQIQQELKNVLTPKFSSWSFSFGLHFALALLLVFLSFELELKPIKKPLSVGAVFKTSSVQANAKDGRVASNIEKAPERKMARVNHAHKKITDAAKMPAELVGSALASSEVEAGPYADESESNDAVALRRPSPMLMNKDQVKVPYPELARQMMIEGIVKMRLTVSDAGKVIDAQILSGPSYGLRNAALMVARKLFFLPATDEFGTAITAKVDHEVVFRLSRPS